MPTNTNYFSGPAVPQNELPVPGQNPSTLRHVGHALYEHFKSLIPGWGDDKQASKGLSDLVAPSQPKTETQNDWRTGVSNALGWKPDAQGNRKWAGFSQIGENIKEAVPQVQEDLSKTVDDGLAYLKYGNFAPGVANAGANNVLAPQAFTETQDVGTEGASPQPQAAAQPPADTSELGPGFGRVGQRQVAAGTAPEDYRTAPSLPGSEKYMSGSLPSSKIVSAKTGPGPESWRAEQGGQNPYRGPRASVPALYSNPRMQASHEAMVNETIPGLSRSWDREQARSSHDQQQWGDEAVNNRINQMLGTQRLANDPQQQKLEESKVLTDLLRNLPLQIVSQGPDGKSILIPNPAIEQVQQRINTNFGIGAGVTPGAGGETSGLKKQVEAKKPDQMGAGPSFARGLAPSLAGSAGWIAAGKAAQKFGGKVVEGAVKKAPWYVSLPLQAGAAYAGQHFGTKAVEALDPGNVGKDVNPIAAGAGLVAGAAPFGVGRGKKPAEAAKAPVEKGGGAPAKEPVKTDSKLTMAQKELTLPPVGKPRPGFDPEATGGPMRISTPQGGFGASGRTASIPQATVPAQVAVKSAPSTGMNAPAQFSGDPLIEKEVARFKTTLPTASAKKPVVGTNPVELPPALKKKFEAIQFNLPLAERGKVMTPEQLRMLNFSPKEIEQIVKNPRFFSGLRETSGSSR